jgi:hypothetical protein
MSHWDKHAMQWHNIGVPLRPSNIDIQIMQSWLQEIWNEQSLPFNVLILGSTPELAAMSWPKNTCLFSIDSNISMIKSVLLKTKMSVPPVVSVGDWLKLPFPDTFFHLVIGDGCYTTLDESNYEPLSYEILRVLHPTGYFFMRFFIKPQSNESIKTVHTDFLAGKITNFHVLKWRIAMALHPSLNKGVSLNAIWQMWAQNFKEYNSNYWPHETTSTIDNYKDNTALYTFPTFDELTTKLDVAFTRLNLHTPNYLLGERCPILKLTPK